MGYGKHGQLGNGTMPQASALEVVSSLVGRMIVKVAAGGMQSRIEIDSHDL
jgi:hypothetical protein